MSGELTARDVIARALSPRADQAHKYNRTADRLVAALAAAGLSIVDDGQSIPTEEVQDAASRWNVSAREATYRLATPYEADRRRERAIALAYILQNERFDVQDGELIPPVIGALTTHVDALVDEGIERVLTLIYGPEEVAPDA